MKQTTWRISGMHCPGCEAAVLNAIKGLPGIESARADYQRGTLRAMWDAEALPEAALARRIGEAGYTLSGEDKPKTFWHRLLRCIAVIAAIAAMGLLASLPPVQAVLQRFPTARPGMGMAALFLLGLMTSLHCVAMCGGINLAQSAASARAGGSVFPANLRYNLGRIAAYAIVGGIVGAIGSAFRLSTGAQAAIQLVAAAFMLPMALSLMDFGAFLPRLPAPLASLRARFMAKGGYSSLVIGLLNGLMPCGPLQAMQLYALATGRWWMGALSMLCFGLGTAPLMLGFGLVSGRLNRRFARPMRITSAVLVLAMGAAMLSNGLALAGVQFNPMVDAVTDPVPAVQAEQRVQSELDWRGYPDITVTAGVPVRWTIHAEADNITGCNREMVIPGLGLRVPLEPGDNVVEFTPTETGVIPYTCWMGMIRGSITVVDP